MESVLGGGVLLAVAAALWLVYLVPNWLRRSEYLATERNAVRLQQTIRVLAETAETPEAVRLENAAKARALEARLRAKQRPVAVGTPAVLEDPTDPRVIAATRLRRTRVAATVVIGIAALALLSQIMVALIGGLAAASTLVVVVSGGFLGAGLWLQGRLAKAQRARRARPSSAAAPATERARRVEAPLPELVDPRAWTPQPLPQPLHQLRREAALRAAAQAERVAAAREAEERAVAARAAAVPQPVVATRPPSERAVSSERQQVVASAAKGRFAAMGVVGDLDAAIPDIDGALARRRAS